MKSDLEIFSFGDNCRKRSLRTNVLLLLTVVLFLFGFAAAFTSYEIYLQASVEQHIKIAKGMANIVANNINPEHVEDYIDNGDGMQEYKDIKAHLYKIRESSPDIKFVYAYKIIEEGCQVVFDLSTKDTIGNAPGDIVKFDESFLPIVPKLLKGEEIEPRISDDAFGWLLTVYVPVRDSKGVCQCYAGVDISMDDIRIKANEYLKNLIIIFSITYLLTVVIAFKFLKQKLLLPINKIANSVGLFAYDDKDDMQKNFEKIRNLNITTGDEIENIYQSFVKMTEDSVKYIEDVKEKNSTIAKMQNALIMTLADLVESRDENTGQHIKKTAAYVKIILKEMKRKGIYKEQLNNAFVENVVQSAPLHDIGKIAVPDSILNKPGKLTKEEFDIMKTHTTVGGKILTSIMEMVSDSQSHYLEEAKNLAMYHHERWDGKGYPTGLEGENIPLSARIMAVADVFDALVSKRSYKDGFPFEKAMSIIVEERGTHFDPLLVDAFVNAEEEVRKVAKEFGE